MSEAVRWILAAFAVYRLSALVAYDDGPGDVFLKLRGRLGAYQYGEDSRPARGVGRLVSCPHCLGIWFAAAVAALLAFRSGIGDAILAVLGLAGVASWLECMTEGRSGGDS